MIRIDEIYNNIFWPWFEKNRPGSRLVYCDPPGRTDPDSLFNLGRDDIKENNFVYFHDQEPVHLDIHQPLFEEVLLRNFDIIHQQSQYRQIKFSNKTHAVDFSAHKQLKPNNHDEYFRKNTHIFSDIIAQNPETFKHGHVVVSELGEHVEQLEKQYGWTSHYYFYHGWACQDWFRGYDKTFLIPRAKDRHPTRTFMSPNRIVAGKRDHRVLFLYNVFKNKLEHNHISAPRICQYENVDITSIAQKYTNVYQDITTVFDQANLPRLFDGESAQQMTSCWLTNFTEAQDSLIYVPTETVYFGRRLHITEKTFKAIALEMPFMLIAPAGSLEYMRSYGFRTFEPIIDESYDLETDDVIRIEKVTQQLKEFDNLSIRERQAVHRACLPIVEHNFNHFYKGDFATILWQEFLAMLNGLKV
jgi:hypothetical protein